MDVNAVGFKECGLGGLRLSRREHVLQIRCVSLPGVLKDESIAQTHPVRGHCNIVCSYVSKVEEFILEISQHSCGAI